MKEGVLIRIYPKEGALEELVQLGLEMIAQARNFTGCLQAHALEAQEQQELSIFQIWENSEAFSDYLIWRSKQANYERAYDLSEKEPDFHCYTILEPPRF